MDTSKLKSDDDVRIVEEATREEFGDLHGGEISLPTSSSLRDFMNSRINEIEALAEAIENPQRTAMIFQQLPKRMRRRVMSHNAKRMPNRLKQTHSDLLEKCGAREVGKRPSRKYRRRPKNLREEYCKRQIRDGKHWLETHIWHAKRFHMINIWGYRLAHFPNDKSFRACYRASAKHCLIQDVSFLGCLEIQGSVEDIKSGLASLTHDSITRKSELNGRREGSAAINHPNGEPIGQINFLWDGEDASCESMRRLWIWYHPAFHSQLYNQLKENFSQSNVSVTSLAQKLLRFRLLGPKAIEVLRNALKPVRSAENLLEWANHYYNSPNRLEQLKLQSEYLDKLYLTSDPGQLPPRSVLPALITTHLPKLPHRLIENVVDTEVVLEKPVNQVASPLWYEEYRQAMMLSNPGGNRSEKSQAKLVSGLSPTPIETTPLAVLLVQRPGRQQFVRQGYGCGIDVICSAGWGMRVWLCLVHNGARAAGLRDCDIVQRDVTLEPPFTPNSKASDQFIDSNNIIEKEKYFRLPPAKRVNFQRLGMSDPFDLPWVKLKEEWETEELIRVYLVSEGKLSRGSRIYLPLPIDLENRKSPPEEPLHPDPCKVKRKELTLKHKRELKRIAKLRKKLRLKNVSNDKLPSSKILVEEHKNIMERLWLGDKDQIRKGNIRETIGFITDGSYSYLEGKCSGYGYITRTSLEALRSMQDKDKSATVLTRIITSFHYTFAFLRITDSQSELSTPIQVQYNDVMEVIQQ